MKNLMLCLLASLAFALSADLARAEETTRTEAREALQSALGEDNESDKLTDEEMASVRGERWVLYYYYRYYYYWYWNGYRWSYRYYYRIVYYWRWVW